MIRQNRDVHPPKIGQQIGALFLGYFDLGRHSSSPWRAVDDITTQPFLPCLFFSTGVEFISALTTFTWFRRGRDDPPAEKP